MELQTSKVEMLRMKLIKARSKYQNPDFNKQFLVKTDIECMLSYQTIKDCIEEADIHAIRHEECCEAIYPGGRKVFTILVLMRRVSLIIKFLERDQMSEETALDSRLPFNREDLITVFEDEAVAIEFEEEQWQVAVPFLRQDVAYRSFHHNTILPFTAKEDLATGGFGEVKIVTIAAGQHAIGPNSGNEVRSHTYFGLENF